MISYLLVDLTGITVQYPGTKDGFALGATAAMIKYQ